MFSVSTFACPHLSHVNEHSTVIPHGAFAEQPSTEIYEGTGALITEQLAAGNGKSEARSDRHTSSDALRVVRLPCGLSAWDPSRYQHECHGTHITASLVNEECWPVRGDIMTTAPCRQAADGGVPDPSIVSGCGYCPTQASCIVAL